ncbi:MAG: YraN family protein [Proteobacteria bacterium]|nr:YraN family protein [Pseudomonadota bacterium]
MPRPSTRADRQATGTDFEALARTHLQAAGLTCLATNARYRVGEIDLVMRDGNAVVFVEVRYRRSAGFGGSAVSVDAAKQRKLVLAAHAFLADHPALVRQPCRFDVVAVEGSADAPRIEWIRNAFEAG